MQGSIQCFVSQESVRFCIAEDTHLTGLHRAAHTDPQGCDAKNLTRAVPKDLSVVYPAKCVHMELHSVYAFLCL